MATKKLNDLCQPMRWFAYELIARAAEAGVALMVIEVLRTHEEQVQKVLDKVSKTMNSKHLPGPDGLSRAIDLCPYETYQMHGPDKLDWNAQDPAFGLVARIAEDVAARQGIKIRKGYDWGYEPGPPEKAGWDPGHYELDESVPISKPVPA